MNEYNKRKINIFLAIVVIITGSIYFFRIDLTSEKRFTISSQSQTLIKSMNEQLQVTIYLDGDLNPGFQRLKKSTKDLIEELSIYSKKSIVIKYVNPSDFDSQEQRERYYFELQKKGLTPTAVYERDEEGKSIEKIIFPCIELEYKGKTLPISLLKNVRGNSGEENLNISIENLEFEITDGIRRISNTTIQKIAFIEGHGELNEAQTYDISKSLSRYFQVDRGVIANDASILDNYKVVIIAKPTTPFSESDKYIIDQYIMRGGRVLWVLDAVRISNENLSATGLSPAIGMDLNLNDILFKYGVRINPTIIQDVQCSSVPINIAPKGTKPQFEQSPWYYAPLLLTSGAHPVSRNITEVKADFASSIEPVGENKLVKAELLLASSDNTHIIGTPTTIDLSLSPKPTDKEYFNTGYVPVAVALEGNFDSNFVNRMQPKGLINLQQLVQKSQITRQIIVADGDIIRNETDGTASDSTTIPLGYDRYMNQQFGNKDFILNSVLYLADNDGWMELRNRTIKLRLLNKQLSSNEKVLWQVINVALPLIILLIMGISYQIIRKKKYTKI